MGICETGILVQRLPKLRHRFVEPALLSECGTETHIRGGIAGAQCQGALIMSLRLVKLAQSSKRRSTAQVRFGIRRCESDRPFVGSQRGLGSALFDEAHAEVQMGRCMVRREFRRPLET